MAEDIFEVEKILGQRLVSGKKEFLIRWKGFGPQEDSWEPRRNLIGCEELLKEFFRLTQASKNVADQETPNTIKKPLEFTKVRTPRKQGKAPEKDEKTPYKILHRTSKPPSTPKVPGTAVTTKSEQTGCPMLHAVNRKKIGALIVLAVLAIILIIFTSKIPGVLFA